MSEHRLVHIPSLSLMPLQGSYVAVGSNIFVMGGFQDWSITSTVSLIVCRSQTAQPLSDMLKACKEKTLSDIAKACKEWGFFQLVSHGTPLELLNKVKELSSDCYKTEGEEAFKTSTPVKLLNELLEKNYGEKLESVDWEDVFTLLDHNQNEWPSNTSGLKETMLEYIGEVMKLASKMMEILTLQASNLTSEDLSLTVLAPTSFTSPISPFLRFFEFTERVQTENAIQQRISISNESSRRQSLGGADIILKLNGFFTTYYPSEATRAIYHGGTNFDRTAGEFMASSYDYDAPLDEYGLTREPKYSHLKALHKVIKLSETALVSADATVTSLGAKQEAHVFWSKSSCAAFLSNNDANSAARVMFRGFPYDLPPWSVSILPDCKTEYYNTAKVNAPRVHRNMVPTGTRFSWESFNEATPSANERDTFARNGLVEQISMTWDKSDYFWYLTDITIGAGERFLQTGDYPLLTIWSAGHALHVFVNGQLAGSAYGGLSHPKLTFSQKIKLHAGVNKLALLSVAVGLPNVGQHFETWNKGVLGPVTLKGVNSGTWDMSKWKWSYKIGVKGEAMSLHTDSSSVSWNQGSYVVKKQPLTWYKSTFSAPGGNEPLALDMNTMGKGHVWINGRNIGRHWPAYKAQGNCRRCNYAGTFDAKKCLSNCGEASQRWYHVPRSWLKSQNLIVVFEEWGGDPNGISLVKRT
ncbi:hypothetical protein F2Q69_00001115 [Brassica cretica]|uniref:beta-galactosidase n=1 Tax=Brassica cretica TaxID=69181 RepID=A0A8S9PJ11_BRACR|nr:hypothetical protein F2Q69_00001115 [Brassica cretica]